MTPRNKKIALGITLTVAAAGIGYLFYRRHENKKNSAALLEYIDSLPKINTSGAVVDVLDKASQSIINEINSTSATALNGKGIVFDGKSYILGKDNKAMSPKAAEIAMQLRDSMKGINVMSNVGEFMKAFSRIGNKNAMVYMNILYKSLYGETMWQAINGEKWLYMGSGTTSVVANAFDIPNYNPVITAHLLKLK